MYLKTLASGEVPQASNICDLLAQMACSNWDIFWVLVKQKSRIECLKGIDCIGCERKCKAVFVEFVRIVSQSLDNTKINVKVEFPYLL